MESVIGQVVGQYYQPRPLSTASPAALASTAVTGSPTTIGQALEATALTAGDKPVDQSDAAAIQAAEVRATGSTVITPGGVAAAAQFAADINARIICDKDKTKLADVLTNVMMKLLADKAATRLDAEGVVGAEPEEQSQNDYTSWGVAAAVVLGSSVALCIPCAYNASQKLWMDVKMAEDWSKMCYSIICYGKGRESKVSEHNLGPKGVSYSASGLLTMESGKVARKVSLLDH